MRFVILAVLVLSGCNLFTKETTCTLAKNAAGAGTVAVGAVLGCTGIEAMATDMGNMLVGNTKICTDQIQAGAVADLACPAVVNYVVATALKELPSAWGCKGSVVTDTAKDQVISLCRQTLPY